MLLLRPPVDGKRFTRTPFRPHLIRGLDGGKGSGRLQFLHTRCRSRVKDPGKVRERTGPWGSLTRYWSGTGTYVGCNRRRGWKAGPKCLYQHRGDMDRSPHRPSRVTRQSTGPITWGLYRYDHSGGVSPVSSEIQD